jgi:hypothetical protein
MIAIITAPMSTDRSTLGKRGALARKTRRFNQ